MSDLIAMWEKREYTYCKDYRWDAGGDRAQQQQVFSGKDEMMIMMARQQDDNMDDLLVVLGYQVQSSDMGDVAQN